MANSPSAKFKASRNAHVAVWDNGDKGFSIKIQPPSYKDDTGVYKESSFWVSDLLALAGALWKAWNWCEERERQANAKTNGKPPQTNQPSPDSDPLPY